jgi:hypothetical protein
MERDSGMVGPLTDYFEMHIRVRIPHPNSDTHPMVAVTTGRIRDNVIMLHGPGFSYDGADLPYPMGGEFVVRYLRHVLLALYEAASVRQEKFEFYGIQQVLQHALLPQPIPDQRKEV